MKSFLSFLLSGIALTSFGQDSSGKWQLSTGLIASTVPTYKVANGDTAFASSLSISPEVSFRHVSGFGLVYSNRTVLGGPKPGLYMHTLTVGLEQYNKKNVDLVADYSRYFFTGNASVPSTPIDNEVYSTVCLKSSFFRPSLSVDMGWGKDKTSASAPTVYDMGVSAGIGHLFQLQNPDVSILPSLFLNGATNEYFSFLTATSYLSHGKGASKYIKSNKGKGGGSGSSTTTRTTSRKVFSLSNVETSFQLEYETGHFAFRPEGNLFFPLEAGLGITGYWQLNAQFNF